MGIPARIPPVAPLPAPQGFQNHIVDGKLVLSLDDSIRLAMVNNTDIHIDQAAVDLAANTVHRQIRPVRPGGQRQLSRPTHSKRRLPASYRARPF